MASDSNAQINKFMFKTDNGGFHLATTHDDVTYILCFWPIRNFSSFKQGISKGFGKPYCFNYAVSLEVNEVELTLSLTSCYIDKQNCPSLKSREYTCVVNFSTYSGKELLQETMFLDDLATGATRQTYMSLTGELFQQLKDLPNNTLLLTFRFIHSEIDIISSYCNSLIDSTEYRKTLEDELTSLSSDYLREKVELHNGPELEFVNKAILCARSPVFERMFKNDMRGEGKENAVDVDVSMPVIKALVSFLHKGEIDNYDMDFLFKLYYCASKYQIRELKEACIGLMLDKVTLDNIIRVLKLSLFHDDKLLMNAVMTLISANVEKVILLRSFKCFMDENPLIGLAATNFFTFRNIYTENKSLFKSNF